MECSIFLNGCVYIYTNNTPTRVTKRNKGACKFIDFVDGMSFGKNNGNTTQLDKVGGRYSEEEVVGSCTYCICVYLYV